MAKKAVLIAALLLITGLLSSCALLFKGESSKVNFKTKPDGAEVIVNGVSYGTTPVEVHLKSDTSYTVELKYHGQTHNLVLQNNVGGLWVVLDILGGFVPLIVDAATGAWYNLSPGQVYYEFNQPAPSAGGSG